MDPINLHTEIFNTPFQNEQRMKSFVGKAKAKGMKVVMNDGRPSEIADEIHGTYNNLQ
jgi:hypothetical protein